MDLIGDLTRIGFTEYEAKVYLALLREHPATGYQISKRSGVPRSMIYEALGRLHARGAVLESIEDRASYYRPLPPDLLLDRQEAEHQRLLRELRTGLQQLYAPQPEERVWSLTGRGAALTYAAQLIRAARAALFLVLTDADLDALREEICAAVARGVATHTLLTGERDLECGQVARHPPVESELQGLTGALLVVADDAEVLIASGDAGETANITRAANLVQIARQFVWMEFFTQRIYARLGPELLERLEGEDRRIFQSLNPLKEDGNGESREAC